MRYQHIMPLNFALQEDEAVHNTITTNEASILLGVHRRTVQRMCDEGVLVSRQVERTGLRLISKKSAEFYINWVRWNPPDR